jgi:hypothetical protein
MQFGTKAEAELKVTNTWRFILFFSCSAKSAGLAFVASVLIVSSSQISCLLQKFSGDAYISIHLEHFVLLLLLLLLVLLLSNLF